MILFMLGLDAGIMIGIMFAIKMIEIRDKQ